MFCYEVQITIDSSITENVRDWFSTHVKKVVEEGQFIKGTWFESLSSDNSAKREWTVHYLSLSKEGIEKYIAEKAPRLRQEVQDKFGDKFVAKRRVLRVVFEN